MNSTKVVKERFVSFETSKLLKEKGFEWERIIMIELPNTNTGTIAKSKVEGNAKPTFGNHCYNEDGKEICPKYYNPSNGHYPRPTLMMAIEWVWSKLSNENKENWLTQKNNWWVDTKFSGGQAIGEYFIWLDTALQTVLKTLP